VTGKIVFCGLAMILFLAIIEKWGFYFGFNLQFYEVVWLLLVPVGLLHLAISRDGLIAPSPLVAVLTLKIAYLGLAAVSIGCILVDPVGDESMSFYLKGILQLSVRTVFTIVLVLVLARLSAVQRRRLLFVNLAAVTLSLIYEVAQAWLMAARNVDLDEMVGGLLLPLTGKEAQTLAPYAYGTFYRLDGLAGDPNLQAAYMITALPFLAAFFLRKPGWIVGLLIGLYLLMLALTMSISGTVGVLASVVLLALLRLRRIRLMHVVFCVLGLIAAMLAVSRFEDEISHLLEVRMDPSGTTTQHLNVARQSLSIYAHHPMGVGYNNFSLAWKASTSDYADRAMNPHNTFLAILVESGPLALLCELATYGLMFWIAIRRRTDLGKVFACCIFGICLGALGYESLDEFYAQTFLFAAFTCVVLGDELGLDNAPRSAGRAMSLRARPRERASLGPTHADA